MASSPKHITWALKSRMPTLEDEMSISSVLVQNSRESGRGIDLPDKRKEEIAAAAERFGFLLSGAMSFRRQLIRQASVSNARYWSSKMQMGSAKEANNHADMFVELVAAFLSLKGIEFVTESMLQQAGSSNTPDFHIPTGCVVNGKLVYWIDCKTFYGAATIASDRKQPAGKLLATARRYNSQFGPGYVMLS